MENNYNIILTSHAKKRLSERFSPQSIENVQYILKKIGQHPSYLLKKVKLDTKGRLLFSYKDLRFVLSVDYEKRNIKIITIYRRIEEKSNLINIVYSSEKRIIEPLLQDGYFDIIKNELQSYPNLENDYSKKTSLIINMMNILWKEKHSKNVKDLFQASENFEQLLVWLNVRDHFIHQFECFILGSYILINLKGKIKNIICSKFRDLNNYNRLLFTWLLASTVHDFGYPAYMCRDLNKKLSELYKKFGLPNLSNIYSEINNFNFKHPSLEIIKVKKISRFEDINLNLTDLIISQIVNERIMPKNDAEDLIQKMQTSFDHGLLSVYIILRRVISIRSNNTDWNQYKISNDFINLKRAALGILFHTGHWYGLENIKFDNYPIIWLMILIDELQEWDRHDPKLKRDYFIELEKIEFINNKIKIEYKPIITNHEEPNYKINNKILKNWNEKRKILNKLKPAKYDEDILIEAILKLKYEKVNDKKSIITTYLCKKTI